MGVCQSAEMKQQLESNRRIERDIQKADKQAKQEAKLLLLGAGEAGKSTLLKQMQILHAGGFTDAETETRKGMVFNNTVCSMVTLLDGMKVYQEQFEGATAPELETHSQTVRFHVKNGVVTDPIPANVYAALKALWATEQIQRVYQHAAQLQLDDSAAYFLSNLDRICSADYSMTDQDVLRTRVATTGVHQIEFEAENLTFRVFDVGGQRSERKKWINCFDNVDAVMYLCSLSEYDQVLREDMSTNRMLESVRLFNWICNHEAFRETSIILFLNKKDLLEEKIKTVSIKVTFPEYSDEDTYAKSVAFIERRYSAQNQNTDRQIYCHQTCATDTQQIEVILTSVIDTIIRANMKKLGWM